MVSKVLLKYFRKNRGKYSKKSLMKKAGDAGYLSKDMDEAFKVLDNESKPKEKKKIPTDDSDLKFILFAGFIGIIFLALVLLSVGYSLFIGGGVFSSILGEASSGPSLISVLVSFFAFILCCFYFLGFYFYGRYSDSKFLKTSSLLIVLSVVLLMFYSLGGLFLDYSGGVITGEVIEDEFMEDEGGLPDEPNINDYEFVESNVPLGDVDTGGLTDDDFVPTYDMEGEVQNVTDENLAAIQAYLEDESVNASGDCPYSDEIGDELEFEEEAGGPEERNILKSIFGESIPSSFINFWTVLFVFLAGLFLISNCFLGAGLILTRGNVEFDLLAGIVKMAAFVFAFFNFLYFVYLLTDPSGFIFLFFQGRGSIVLSWGFNVIRLLIFTSVVFEVLVLFGAIRKYGNQKGE
jgi:hypothetical protein